VIELRLLLAELASSPEAYAEGSVLKDRSSGSLEVDKASRMFAKVLRAPSNEAVVSVGLQLLSMQEIDLFPMANKVELVVRSAWDCSEVDNGFTATPQVKAVALGWRKKRKQLGFLILEKLGLGIPGFVFGLVFGSDFKLIFGSGFGLGTFSHPVLAEASMESSMVVDEQVVLWRRLQWCSTVRRQLRRCSTSRFVLRSQLRWR
jgi:hypothetical protein